MDAIEKAIRNAFEKGNAEDRTFREKVYRAAFAALDRALQANPNVTVELAINRRKAVQAKITEIESEFLPAVPAAAPAPGVAADASGGATVPSVEASSASEPPADQAAPAVEAPRKETDAPMEAPAVDPDRAAETPAEAPAVAVGEPMRPAAAVDRPAGPAADQSGERPPAQPVVPEVAPEPVLAGAQPVDLDAVEMPTLAASGPSGGAAEEVSPDRDERRARGRRFPAGLILGVVLLAAIAAGGWWALQSGLVKLPGSTGVAQTGTQSASGDDSSTSPGETSGPAKPGQADQGRNWVTVFSPSDPTQVTAPPDARAEAMQDDTGAFLRVRSGPSGAPVTFNVGQGVLEQVAGKHAVFDIVARAEEGKETQMSVNCDFGALGDCGRKRYSVGHERNEYLFDVRLPNEQPAAGGTIAIDSDFDKQGKSVDIYEIRVSAVPD